MRGILGTMKNIKAFLYRILCGIFLGLSTFAPGFSGSVMALAMGIYHPLVEIVSNPVKEVRKNIRFLAPLGIGVLISAVFFVFGFRFLFERHERATLLLFMGLIAGNLPVIAKQLRSHKLQTRDIVGGLLSFSLALAFGLMAVGGGHVTGTAGVTVSFPMVAISGFLAGAVTLVPGMSISAILIMLGVYGQLLVMAESLLLGQLTYVPQLIGLILAAILGLALSARGIKRAFDRAPGLSNICVVGFMSGTLVGIFAESLYLADAYFNWLLGGALFLLGLCIATGFVALGRYMNKRAEE